MIGDVFAFGMKPANGTLIIFTLNHDFSFFIGLFAETVEREIIVGLFVLQNIMVLLMRLLVLAVGKTVDIQVALRWVVSSHLFYMLLSFYISIVILNLQIHFTLLLLHFSAYLLLFFHLLFLLFYFKLQYILWAFLHIRFIIRYHSFLLI